MKSILAFCLPVFAAASLSATPSPEMAGPDAAPKVHPLSRYSAIWDSGWFAVPESLPTLELATTSEAPFPFKVVGLADWNGRQWAYLKNDSGAIVELTFGLPSNGLSLIRIEADPSGSGDAVVHIRQGSRTLPLRLSHSAQFADAPLPPEHKMGLPTPSRPYAGWDRKSTSAYRPGGSPGHRIPGTTPAPPTQTAQR